MAAATTKKIVESSSKIVSLTDNLEEFLSAESSHSKKYTEPLKNLYDISKTVDQDKPSSAALQELIVSGFDDEQIWQQLELENDLCISNLLNGAAKIISNKKRCTFKPENLSSLKLTSKPKQGKEKVVKGVKKQKNVLESEISDKVSRLRKSSKENEYKDDEDDYLDIEEEDFGDDDGDDDNDDIADIEKKLDDFDKDDKFFDFTGDSDEDLNFDFGPLGQKGDLDEELFNDDSAESHNGNKSKQSENKKKKSVTFKDDTVNERNISSSKKDSKKQAKKYLKKGSIVDDAFFKLSELEEFLDKEDRREEIRLRKEKNEADSEEEEDEEEEDNEDIDMFGDEESEDEDAHYEDFFDPPDGEVEGTDRDGEVNRTAVQKKSQSNLEENEEEDLSTSEEDSEGGLENRSDVPNQLHKVRHGQDLFADSESEGEDVADIIGGKKEAKSSYEVRQDRLKKKISAIEDDMLSEKPWQLAGEITGGKRPENSLLQENLQFEHTTRLPPEITEETTKTLEDLIKQRIKDKAWDDVERKVKPKDNPFEYKKRITLDQEKSKLSLSQIYEQEYLKQQKSEETEKSDPNHDDIKNMMQSLFIKLDALSNFHYTPKQASAEVTVVTNQPSISIEEVAPVSVSDGQLLAPEEVKNKEHHDIKGTTERTKSDRLKERKRKKKNQKLRQKEKEKREKLIDKLNPGLGNKYSKEKALRKLEKESKSDHSGVTLLKEDKKEKTGLTSSKAFFTQLQDEVTAGISRKRRDNNQNRKQSSHGGKKFKL